MMHIVAALLVIGWAARGNSSLPEQGPPPVRAQLAAIGLTPRMMLASGMSANSVQALAAAQPEGWSESLQGVNSARAALSSAVHQERIANQALHARPFNQEARTSLATAKAAVATAKSQLSAAIAAAKALAVPAEHREQLTRAQQCANSRLPLWIAAGPLRGTLIRDALAGSAGQEPPNQARGAIVQSYPYAELRATLNQSGSQVDAAFHP